MRKKSIAYVIAALLALTTLTAQVRDSGSTSDRGITRRLIIDQPNVRVGRSTYGPGAVEPRGPHPYDAVLVPLIGGDMRVEIAGKSVDWKVGEPLFIPRGIEHNLANRGKTPVDFIVVRIP